MDETPLLKKLQTDKNTTLPFGILTSINYNSDTGAKVGIKPLSAGSLTKTLSYFLSASKGGKNIYLQYNKKKTNVIRAGFLNPYTQITSVNKISSNIGIGCDDDCDKIIKIPIQYSSLNGFKGVEYSYLKNNITLLVSVGKTQDNLSQKTCIDKYDIDYANKTQKTISLKYNSNGLNIGIIRSDLSDSNLTNYTINLFVEKEFDNISLYISHIYNNEDIENYNGTQSMLYYDINTNYKIKAFNSFDTLNNKISSIGVDRFYKQFIFNITAGDKQTDDFDTTYLQLGIKYYY
jgi:hypothetical protein